MKKAIFASIVMLASMTSCQNETTEILTPANYEAKVNVKTSAREGERLTLEDVKQMSLDNPDTAYMNPDTKQVVFRGNLVRETPFEYNDITNPGANADRKVKTICSIKEDGVTHSVVHVYDDHYSGYQMVTTISGGFSASYEIHTGPALACLALYMTTWW